VTTTCPNDHANPDGQHFCGECGAPLTATSAVDLHAQAALADAEAAEAEAHVKALRAARKASASQPKPSAAKPNQLPPPRQPVGTVTGGPGVKTRKVWPWVLGVFLLGICTVFVLSGGGSEKTSGGSGGSAGGCGSSGPTCDATPKVDGVYRVSGGGTFDVGVSSGWIESAGPRDPARYPNCMWARLSGPDPSDIKMMIETNLADGSKGRTRVLIKKTDYAFWSKGCQPWERLSRE
jgi:hypothetical protein